MALQSSVGTLIWSTLKASFIAYEFGPCPSEKSILVEKTNPAPYVKLHSNWVSVHLHSTTKETQEIFTLILVWKMNAWLQSNEKPNKTSHFMVDMTLWSSKNDFYTVTKNVSLSRDPQWSVWPAMAFDNSLMSVRSLNCCKAEVAAFYGRTCLQFYSPWSVNTFHLKQYFLQSPFGRHVQKCVLVFSESLWTHFLKTDLKCSW